MYIFRCLNRFRKDMPIVTGLCTRLEHSETIVVLVVFWGFFLGGWGGFGGVVFWVFFWSCMESKHSTIRFAAVRIVLTFYLIMRIYCRENIRDRVKRINKSLFQISINKSTLSIPEYNFASLISLSLQVCTEDNSL